MASCIISIGGAESRAQKFDITVELGLGKRAKRAHGEVWIETTGGAIPIKPLTGQPIDINIEGRREFAGALIQASGKLFSPALYVVSFEAMDYSLQLDAKLVTKDFDEQPLSERVQEILSEYAPGFSLGTIHNNQVIPEQSIEYRECSAIFDELAELTNQYFELKFDKSVNFYQVGEAAPSLGEYDMSGLVVTEDWSDLHNVVIIKDFNLRSSYTIDDEFATDGILSFFGLTYPPWSVEDTTIQVKRGENPWVTRTAIDDPLGLQSEYETYTPGPGDPEEETEEHKEWRLGQLELERQEILNGAPGEAYVCIWNIGIRFPLCDLPGEGDLIRITYPFERRQQALESRDETSIALMAARSGTDGVYEKVYSLPELRAVSLDAAIDYAEMLLARGAWPSITGTFKTYVVGWEPGQIFNILGVDDPRGGAAELWVSNVVKRIVAVEDGQFKVEHEVSFTNQPQAIPITLDEFLHRLVDRTRISPPGTAPTGTIASTTTTTSTMTATSTTTTMMPRAILITKYTPYEW